MMKNSSYGVVVFGAAATALAAPPSFQIIQEPTGAPADTRLFAVSGDGVMMCGRYSIGAPNNQPFMTDGNTVSLIDDGLGGPSDGTPTSLNGDGSVAVGHGLFSMGYEAFRWESGVAITLGFLPGYTSFSGATDVSADGSIIVGRLSGNPLFRAFVWDAVNGMQPLPDLPGGLDDGAAAGISGDGQVIVGRGRTPTSACCAACRWDNGVVTELPNLFSGWDHSAAIDVNINGSIIVGVSSPTSSATSNVRACIWTLGQVIDLFDLPGGAILSNALAVSGNGLVVVGRATTDIGPEAFVWDPYSGMQSLGDLLVADYGLDLGGWIPREAWRVSDDGTVIVGWADHLTLGEGGFRVELPAQWWNTGSTCVGDITTQGAAAGHPWFGVPDGSATASDINYFVNAWVAGDDVIADVTTQGHGAGDPLFGVPDGLVTASDINYFVNAWVAGCP